MSKVLKNWIDKEELDMIRCTPTTDGKYRCEFSKGNKKKGVMVVDEIRDLSKTHTINMDKKIDVFPYKGAYVSEIEFPKAKYLPKKKRTLWVK